MSVINAEAALSTGARGEAGTVAERALSTAERARGEADVISGRALSTAERARGELAQFLQDLEAQATSARNRATDVGTRAASILQPQVAQTFQDRIGIEGYRGGIVSPGEAGLSAIGQIGGDILGEGLKKTPTTKPSTFKDLTSLRGEGAEYDPFLELEGFTGSGMIERKKKFPNLLTVY